MSGTELSTTAAHAHLASASRSAAAVLVGDAAARPPLVRVRVGGRLCVRPHRNVCRSGGGGGAPRRCGCLGEGGGQGGVYRRATFVSLCNSVHVSPRYRVWPMWLEGADRVKAGRFKQPHPQIGAERHTRGSSSPSHPALLGEEERATRFSGVKNQSGRHSERSCQAKRFPLPPPPPPANAAVTPPPGASTRPRRRTGGPPQTGPARCRSSGRRAPR